MFFKKVTIVCIVWWRALLLFNVNDNLPTRVRLFLFLIARLSFWNNCLFLFFCFRRFILNTSSLLIILSLLFETFCALAALVYAILWRHLKLKNVTEDCQVWVTTTWHRLLWPVSGNCMVEISQDVTCAILTFRGYNAHHVLKEFDLWMHITHYHDSPLTESSLAWRVFLLSEHRIPETKGMLARTHSIQGKFWKVAKSERVI